MAVVQQFSFGPSLRMHCLFIIALCPFGGLRLPFGTRLGIPFWLQPSSLVSAAYNLHSQVLAELISCSFLVFLFKVAFLNRIIRSSLLLRLLEFQPSSLKMPWTYLQAVCTDSICLYRLSWHCWQALHTGNEHSWSQVSIIFIGFTFMWPLFWYFVDYDTIVPVQRPLSYGSLPLCAHICTPWACHIPVFLRLSHTVERHLCQLTHFRVQPCQHTHRAMCHDVHTTSFNANDLTLDSRP